MNWLNIDWLKAVVSPKEFQMITIIISVSLFLSFALVKADRVIENQSKIREEQKLATAERKDLMRSMAGLEGQARDKNEVLRAISNQASQNTQYINAFCKKVVCK